MSCVVFWCDDVCAVLVFSLKVIVYNLTYFFCLICMREGTEVVWGSFSDAVDVVEPNDIFHLLMSHFHF